MENCLRTSTVFSNALSCDSASPMPLHRFSNSRTKSFENTYLDISMIVYLNDVVYLYDILIYSKIREVPVQHIKQVLARVLSHSDPHGNLQPVAFY